MAASKTYKTRGIVLRRSPMGEADRLLTIFTPEQGKVRVVARGVRRIKSKLAGHLEPLTYVSVSISRGRTLDVVSEAQTVRSFIGLREDLSRMSQAVYLAEIADAFSTEREPSPEMFQLLLTCLDALESTGKPYILLRWFEVRMLDAAGFRPELYECIECRSRLEPGDYVYSSARGGALCSQCRTASPDPVLPLSLGANKVMRYYQRRTLSDSLDLEVPARVLAEAGRLTRAYIRYVLERDLNSIELMDMVAR